MIGFDRQTKLINLGDSAELNAFLYDNEDAPLAASLISAVEFSIQRPDGTIDSQTADVDADGVASTVYQDTDAPGEYIVVAQFTLTNGVVRSTRSDFAVTDPFNPDAPSEEQIIADRVWKKLNDLFDSEDGGPWMRDMTLNVFSEAQLPEFIDEAIFDINVYNPPTHFDIGMFATPLVINGVDKPNPNLTVLVQGVLVHWLN
jgi:hypothetical protein